MKFKQKKCDKVDFNLPDHLHKDLEQDFIGTASLRDVLSVTEGVEQINLLKEIESHLLQKNVSENELHLVIDGMCIMFYQAPNKSSHKRALHRTIQEISGKYPSIVEKYLHKSVECITKLPASNSSTEEIEITVLHIIYLLDNFKLGKKVVQQNFENVWRFCSFILKNVIEYLKHEKIHQKMNDCYNVCQNILKLVTLSIQNSDHLKNSLKIDSEEKFQASTKDMITCFEYLLTHEETKLNCRLNAAFAYCHYYYFSFGGKKLKDDILSESTVQLSLSSRLCIFSSIMAILPAEDFVETTDMIADKILLDIIKISKNSNSSEVLLLCARNVLQWTNVIQNIFSTESKFTKNQISSISLKFFEDNELLNMLIEYVLHCRDHFIDSIRHLSKDIFRNILNIHIASNGIEPIKSPLLKDMTNYLLKDLPPHNRGKYGMLSCIVEKIGTETILEWHPFLPIELYEAFEECSLISHVSELCQVLFSNSLDSIDDKTFQNIWLVPLLNVLCEGSMEQTNAINEHVLPKLLDIRQSSLIFLLSELTRMWENNIGNSFSGLITCLKLYQRQKGSLNYLKCMSNNSLKKAFFHADDQVRLSAFSLLCESFKSTEPIDVVSFELIKFGLPYNINCQSPPFRQQLISYMKKLFTRMHESGYALMKKQSIGKDKNVLPKLILPIIYQEFLQWLKIYLFNCLHPGANFPRRVTSLNLLYILHEMFYHSLPIVDSEVALQTLLYALQDTYEHNKILALKILSSDFSMKLDLEDETLFQSILILASSTKPPDTAAAAYLLTYIVHCPPYQLLMQRHLQSLHSQESHFALTFPDIHQLCDNLHFKTILLLMYELEKQFNLAKRSLLEAAACAPLYGMLTCIRSLLNDATFDEVYQSQWQCLIKEIIQLSLNIIHVVEPIVCNSSPEGHLPMDTDIESIAQLQTVVRRALGSRFQSAVVQEHSALESDTVVLDIVKTHAVTAQILLLCCWRTHKEISLLFGDITEKLPIRNPSFETSSGILSVSQVKDIGNYFLRQMTLVKHKGAFEQAQIGFCKICNTLWRCDISELYELPKIWLEDMILSMRGLKKDIKLCSTRRSAGLPFVIQAILTSEPCFSNSSFFRKSMLTFLDLAQPTEGQIYDVVIHSMNVLRTLFRDSFLGEAVMPFVSEGLQIAIKGFKSQYWAVRNSSTMLFSALMNRVFGVNRSHDEAGKKNRLTGKCFYSRFKGLYFFLIDEIKQCVSLENSSNIDVKTKISIQPSLYPILLLLGRLYPAPSEEDTILSVFIPYLQICTSSPIWKTRLLAARALVSFTPHEKVFSSVESFLQMFALKRPFNQNEIHGELSQLLYFMEEIGYMTDVQSYLLMHDLEFAFFKSLPIYIRQNKCASTKAAYLQIYLYSMVLGVETVDLFHIGNLFQAVKEDFFAGKFADPDKDNYLAIAASILFLKCCQLKKADFMKIVNGKICPKEIVYFLLFNPHKTVSATVAEILLWLLQDDCELCRYSLDSADDVIVERVLKTVTLIDKKYFDVEKLKEDSYFCRCLTESFHSVKDGYLLRQYCRLMSFVPSSLTRFWQFAAVSHSCDLINKLEYVLNKMENCFRDDLTSELFLYSTQIVITLAAEYDLCKEGTSIIVENDFDIIEKWLEKALEYAYPDNSIVLRQAVVFTLGILAVKNLFPKSKLLGLHSSCLWQSLMLLLIDDEPEIKQRASEIVIKMKLSQCQGNDVSSAVPSKAIDIMVEMFVENNFKDSENCISILINWMMSSNGFSLDFMSDEQPFDKGELNVYSEDLIITNIVSKHLSSYLAAGTALQKNIICEIVLCWKDKQDNNLTFAEAITLCLTEAKTSIENFLGRAAMSPILDAYFDQELIQISQRLAVAGVLLSFSEILPNFIVLGNELLQKFQSLNFRTFFIENIISDILKFLSQL